MLTPKRRAFARHIVEGRNPCEAYRLAGYSVENMKPSSVRAEAYRLRRVPDVSQLIEKGMREAAADSLWTAAESAERLFKVNTESYTRIMRGGPSAADARLFLETLDRLDARHNIAVTDSRPVVVLGVEAVPMGGGCDGR